MITINYYHLQSLNSKAKLVRVNTKRHKHPFSYKSNSSATFNLILSGTFKLILSGDTPVNPGPGSNVTKCSACKKTVKCNQKRFIYDKFFNATHEKCSNLQTLVLNSRVPCYWICSNCSHTVLPFFKSSSIKDDICNLNTFTELEHTTNLDTFNQLETINNDITVLNKHINHKSLT